MHYSKKHEKEEKGNNSKDKKLTKKNGNKEKKEEKKGKNGKNGKNEEKNPKKKESKKGNPKLKKEEKIEITEIENEIQNETSKNELEENNNQHEEVLIMKTNENYNSGFFNYLFGLLIIISFVFLIIYGTQYKSFIKFDNDYQFESLTQYLLFDQKKKDDDYPSVTEF